MSGTHRGPKIALNFPGTGACDVVNYHVGAAVGTGMQSGIWQGQSAERLSKGAGWEDGDPDGGQ